MKDKHKLLLHIGPHKTGTTALQMQLAESRNALGTAGWIYKDRLDCGISVHAIGDMLSTGQLKRAQPAMAELSSFTQNMILSSENFSRLHANHIRLLAEATADFDVTIIYYIRNPLQRLFSAWQEWVKHGYSFTFPEYIMARLANFMADPEVNDLARIKRWKTNFPRADFRVENYDIINDVPGDFFRKFLGTEYLIARPTADRVNVSTGIAQTEAIRASNGAYRTLTTHETAQKRFKSLFLDIVGRIQDFEKQGRYIIRYRASIDGGPFKILEKKIMTTLPGLPKKGNFVFQTRDVEWKYIDSNIWCAEPNLMLDMSRIRCALKEEFGRPDIDTRLRRI